jgi:DNA primase small subunit
VTKIEAKTFVQQKFSEYYQQHASSINLPSSPKNREFAFLLFKEKMMIRHKGAKEPQDFQSLLKTIVPSDVYYSSAHYEKPEEEMESKGWLGADLVFDIDADHIATPCGKQHDTWTCTKCGTKGRGSAPDKCPNPSCGGQKFDDTSWPCEICLETTKRETVKLIDVLTDDFGFATHEIAIGFSGHRGYHAHVESDIVQSLDQIARREIVDYLVGIGFEPKLHGLEEGVNSSLDEAGWRGRVARGTYEFLFNSSPEQLEETGLSKGAVNSILANRDNILKEWKDKTTLRIKGVGPENWKRIIRKAVEQEAVQIDTVVTTDIHRLIRLADTLHGKTGLKKVIIPVSDIDSFDPLKSAVAFRGGAVRLFVSEAPEFRLGDTRYGPFKDAEVELPTAAALFLLCKRAAILKETN